MSTHEDFSREHTVKPSSDRAFGLVFATVFAVIGLWPLLGDGGPRWWALAVAAAFAILAVAAPALLGPASRLWQKVGRAIHVVVGPLVTGLMYYGAVVPTGLIMRLLGKDLLHLKLDSEAKSYWIERQPPGPPPDGMPRQF